MIRSMTGFASKTLVLSLDKEHKVNMSISLKSLNSRFFEATCKLPYALNSLETVLIKHLQKKLHRGHIYFTVYMSNQQALKNDVEADMQTIQGYVNAINNVKKQLPIEGNLSASDLLQIPSAFITEERDFDETSRQEILNVVDQLIHDLIKAQQEEGQSLKQDLEQRIGIMRKKMTTIESSSAILIAQQKEKVRNALAEISANDEEMTELRKNALYAVLDKMDINEEIVRFKSHLENLETQLSAVSEEKGKRLDFTLQELGREINTLAAKCSDAAIGSLAIDIKVELEKAREQTQNIV